MRRFSLVLAIFCLAGATFAGLPPTQAWRWIFNNGTADDIAGGLDVDASGNAYLLYVSSNSGANTIHMLKIGPAGGIYYDKTVAEAGFVYDAPIGVLVSPMIAGKQYVYAFLNRTNSTPFGLSVYKWDTNGNAIWANPVFFSGGTTNDLILAGSYADGSDNLLLALGYSNINSLQGSLSMVTLDHAGNITSQQTNNLIVPQTAVYIPASHGWIAGGIDMNPSPTVTLNGRWDLFDPSTGLAAGIGEHADGYRNGFFSITQQFLINPLPGNAFAVVHNTTSENGNMVPSYTTIAKVYSAPGTLAWQYPPSTPWGAYTLQIVRMNTSSPYLMLSQIPGTSFSGPYPRIMDEFSSTGALVWQHTHQPADVLLPSNDGFFTAFFNTANNVEYLEHADLSGTYDFGKGYVGTATNGPMFAAFKGFQNSMYYVNNTRNATTVTDVVIDRFVTGVAMQSIAGASSVQSGQPLQATITLNGAAPAGGVSVGVSSSSPKLLLPNNTQGQFITVPAGSSTAVVTLTAQTVTVNTPVRVLAIQNGIRRFFDVTVTP